MTVQSPGLRRWLGSFGTRKPSRRVLRVMAVEKCLYKTLGVSRAASKADIKAAYRRLARIYHPDVNPVSLGPEKFQVGPGPDLLHTCVFVLFRFLPVSGLWSFRWLAVSGHHSMSSSTQQHQLLHLRGACLPAAGHYSGL